MFILKYLNKKAEYITPSNDGFLKELRKINIFVGANNSGKSRFLRSIFESKIQDCVFFENEEHISKLKQILDLLRPRFEDKFFMKGLIGLCEDPTGDFVGRFNSFMQEIADQHERSSRSGGIWNLDVAMEIINEMSRRAIFSQIDCGKYSIENFHTYIPMLRGLRNIDVRNSETNKDDLYKMRTEKDYAISVGDHRIIFTGLTIYAEIKRMLLGNKKDRKFIEEFEGFLSENFFKSAPISLVPDYEKDHIKIDIGNGEDFREIYNVGDGIQSIIISTFQAFRMKDSDLILFLEEPELTMHPSVQRTLIEVLIKRFPRLQVFLTTHSNHFLDLAYDYSNDVSIFSFRKADGVDKFYIENATDSGQILDLLGVRNSSVFLANCVIWTEGVTDRMLLRQLLKLKPGFVFKEDLHYAFAEYGGGNLENFDFINAGDDGRRVDVKKLSRKNYIVMDNDGNRMDSTKTKRRQAIKRVLGEDKTFDDHIEIENLIPFRVWVDIIKKILHKYPKKQIEFIDGYLHNEADFNKNLEKKKIGKLMKKYLVKKKNNEIDLKYFNSDSIQCLGCDKKEIMDYVLLAIDDLKLPLRDFPIITLRIVESIVEFIESANETNLVV